MTVEIAEYEVVAVLPEQCPGLPDKKHAIEMRVKGKHGDAELKAYEVIELIRAGAVVFMIPPEGAPAYAAYKATGLPLVLQFDVCKGCKQEVLFA